MLKSFTLIFQLYETHNIDALCPIAHLMHHRMWQKNARLFCQQADAA